MAEWFAFHALALTLALVLDALLGEPVWLWRRAAHPVVLIGRLIGWLDARMNVQVHPPLRQKCAGVLALLVLVVVVGGASLAALALAGWLHPALAFLLHVAIGAILLAQRSLHEHVEAVRAPLQAGELPAARQALSMIVGRNTATLDESDMARAALESLAENHSDGVIAPAFWFLVGGAPGIALYKAINTADSMIGHKTPRHLHFGWAAARLDDALNFLPARLSVVLIAVGALVARLAPPSLAGVLRDAPTHASPNAGWPEASYAGALGIALGGPRRYGDRLVDAPFINGAGRRRLTADDIAAGLALFRATCMATIALVGVLAFTGFWPW